MPIASQQSNTIVHLSDWRLNSGSTTLQKAPQTLMMNHEISLGCSRS